MNCPKCGKEAQPHSAYCPHCGDRLDDCEAAGPGTPGREDALPDRGWAPGELTPDDSLALPPDAAAVRASSEVPSRQEETKLPDQTLWEGRYDFRGMAGRLLATGLITIAVLALGIWWPWGGTVWMIVLVLLLLGWVGQYLVYVVRHYGHRYRLTPQTFFHESGILVRSSSPIEIIAIADISFQQTILDRLLGVGTIRIVSADRSDPELKLLGIRDVDKVFATIDQVRRAERRRRALRIDNV